MAKDPEAPIERVLLVDDEEAVVELLSASLAERGYRVTGFANAELALDAFQSAPRDFDAVVSDLSMPGMSGLHLAGSLLEIRPGTPIILMSGYLRAEDEATAKELGLLGFAEKGYSIEEIAQAVDRILRGDRGTGR